MKNTVNFEPTVKVVLAKGNLIVDEIFIFCVDSLPLKFSSSTLHTSQTSGVSAGQIMPQ